MAEITIGVPAYRGERFVEETLASLQAQTFRDIEVHISLDGPDPETEALCEPFLADPRFQVFVQAERLGWVENINWLMRRASTPWWCYQQQDDLVDPTYLETLHAHGTSAPEAAVIFSDIVCFGLREGTVAQATVAGSPAARQLALLFDHLPAVALRGLARTSALHEVGAIGHNEAGDFCCDTTWMSAMARAGELQRVPQQLYRKRYHDANEHLRWAGRALESRIEGWAVHCVDMLEQAMRAPADAQERRLLFQAGVGRLTSPRTVTGYLAADDLTREARATLLATFQAVAARRALDMAGWLGVKPRELRRLAHSAHRIK